MSDLVLDASMALSWLLPDEASEVSVAVQADLTKAESVWVAAHWRLEVANSLCMAERRKRLDATGIAQAVALFTQLPVSIDPETNNRASAETLSLARQHALSVYDAAYLELALRRGATLATLDGDLRGVAKKLGVPVLPKKLKDEKTPVLTADEARTLLDSIDTKTVVGLRDRAFIGVMVYSFARVSAVCGMRLGDFYQVGRRSWIRLHEKGGKFHEVPAHHNAIDYLDAYLKAAGLEGEKTPLFRTTRGKSKQLTANPMSRFDVFRMIRRRAIAAGVSAKTCCHTFRATGITAYLSNGGTVEKAQQIAAHESPRTTKLYDRTNDEITLDEVERILI